MRITNAYKIPFEVRHAPRPLLASGAPVRFTVNAEHGRPGSAAAIGAAFELFVGLAGTGALAGSEIDPGNSASGLRIQPSAGALATVLDVSSARIDERAIVVFAHMMLACHERAPLKAIEISMPGRAAAAEALECDDSVLSTYPGIPGKLPFVLLNEDPEGGGYTFTAQLRKPLSPRNAEYLENALKRWTDALSAGAYGLAPISPAECFVEVDDERVTFFENTVEWSVLKLRADPASINGTINIFAAFHHRCQELVSLAIE